MRCSGGVRVIGNWTGAANPLDEYQNPRVPADAAQTDAEGQSAVPIPLPTVSAFG